MTQSTARSWLLVLLSVGVHACAGGPQPAPPLQDRDSGAGDAAAGFGGAGGIGGQAGGRDGGGGFGAYGGTSGVGGAGGQGGLDGDDAGVPNQCEPEDAGLDADTVDAGDAACIPPEDASVGDSQD